MELDLTAPNPMHERCLPGDAWSTVNAAENYQGVMSPLGYTYWMGIAELGITGCFYDLGVLKSSDVKIGASPGERNAGIFFGRYAGNVNYFRRLCDLTPGTSGDAFESQIFGTVRPDAPSCPSMRRYPVVALKAPVLVARLPKQIATMTRRMREWWTFATSPAGLARSGDVQLRDAYEMTRYAIRTHMSGTFLAQAMFDKLGGLAERIGRPGLHLEISTGYGQLEETALVADLLQVAHGGASLEEFLATYGFRCAGEVELSVPSWRERPSMVERLVAKYRLNLPQLDPAEQERQRMANRIAAERTLLAELPAVRRPGARLVLRLAHTFIPLREQGKAALARGFDGCRAAARSRGRELVAGGVLSDVDDVFYLTLEEILGSAPPDACSLVAHRRALRTAYEKFNIPARFEGNPEPVPIEEAGPDRVTELSGVAAAFGTVEGRARVILDAEECDQLEPGEILVCRTTDPSWALAFHLAAGCVIDIGSASSHGAIIAREMGLPCVINTGNGTSLLRTGDLLHVDGTSGAVTVLEPLGSGTLSAG